MSMRKRTAIVAALVVLGVIGFILWRSLGPAPADGALILYGNVDVREVELAFRVPGRLLAVDFDEGDVVTAGQAVARLDAEPFAEALAVADARVDQARVNLAKHEAGTRPQEIQRARDNVRAARAAFDEAERNATRQAGLLDSGATSARVADAARARRDETAAALSAAEESLALAEEGFRSEDVAAAQAELAAATALREQAQTQLDDTVLYAPSDGILLARLREPGSMIAPATPIFALSLTDPIYVRAYVDEPNLGAVMPGTRVTVTSDSSPTEYGGQVGFVAPRAEFTPKTVQTTDLRTDLVYRLRIVVADGGDGLLQGMPVTVRVPRAGVAE